LGGVYATLCSEHARKHSGADIVFEGSEELEALKLIADLTSFKLRTPNPEVRTSSYPAFDLYPRLDYVCIATTRGCPLRCSYCASPFLAIGFFRRDPCEVVDEIEYWKGKYGISHVAFYDDALLIDPPRHIIPILKEIVKRHIHCDFHTPNGLHIREMDEETASLLFRTGFKTIRLGFETSNEAMQLETGGKVDNQAFKDAIKHLKRAGYSGEGIGVYIMSGLPGQKIKEVEESIAFVKEKGARPMLAEYSPIPHTPLFEKAKRVSLFDIENEPLYHNNSILPCQWDGFTATDFRKLKEELNI
jgi:radical SAM superfamily enzyme YgiQ (UPF0313 family)